jgi:hypothetical protein
MKTTHPGGGFEFRFEAGALSLLATCDRLPARTFQVLIAGSQGSSRVSCGFVEFVELGEASDTVFARIMRKLHDTVQTFPEDFPEAAFRDALSHWLLFNFDTPLRHVQAEPNAKTPTQ